MQLFTVKNIMLCSCGDDNNLSFSEIEAGLAEVLIKCTILVLVKRLYNTSKLPRCFHQSSFYLGNIPFIYPDSSKARYLSRFPFLVSSFNLSSFYLCKNSIVSAASS